MTYRSIPRQRLDTKRFSVPRQRLIDEEGNEIKRPRATMFSQGTLRTLTVLPMRDDMTEPRLTVRLKKARLAAGLTQLELARRSGISRKTVNTVENAIFMPSIKVALRLARELQLSVEELFGLGD